MAVVTIILQVITRKLMALDGGIHKHLQMDGMLLLLPMQQEE